jgi:PHD/YefM family antitoxin component YafN of YafNO toxin-antitoxin module
MTVRPLLSEPSRLDEPQAAHEYAEVLSQVAAEGRPIILRRNGADLAAVVSVDHLELMREILARENVEKLAAQLDCGRLVQTHRPPQAWFDDDDNPFEPEQKPAP